MYAYIIIITSTNDVVQVPRRMIGTDGFQETPIVEVTRPITKHNYLVMDIKDLPRIVKEAFYLARSGRPGKHMGVFFLGGGGCVLAVLGSFLGCSW